MSAVSLTYFTIAPECMGFLRNKLNIGSNISYPAGICVGIAAAVIFSTVFTRKTKPQYIQTKPIV